MGSVRNVANALATTFFVFAGSSPSWAVPTALPYVGFLMDADEIPLDAPVDMRVALFDAETDGQQVWPPGVDAQEYLRIEVFDGVMSFVLGDEEMPLDALVLAETAELWLAFEVRLTGDEEYVPLSPRQSLLSVPYALVAERSAKAADAEQLGGLAPVHYVQQPDLVPLVATAGFVQETDLCPVATSCAYGDLVDTPDPAVFVPRAEFDQLAARLWCLENCDPQRLGDCRARTCDGAAQACTDAGPLPNCPETIPWARLTEVPLWLQPSGTVARTQYFHFPLETLEPLTPADWSEWKRITKTVGVFPDSLRLDPPLSGTRRQFRMRVSYALDGEQHYLALRMNSTTGISPVLWEGGEHATGQYVYTDTVGPIAFLDEVKQMLEVQAQVDGDTAAYLYDIEILAEDIVAQ